MSLRPRLVAAALTACGLAAAAGYVLWPSGRHVATCRPLHAAVPDAAAKALAAYATRISYSVERSGSRVTGRIWSDPLTGRTRQVSFDRRGRVSEAFATLTRGHSKHATWVLYGTRRWQSSVTQVPAANAGSGNTAAAIAQVSRDKVADGTARILGRQVVDGVETLHLRETLRPRMPKLPANLQRSKGIHLQAPPPFRVDTWVEALTYLPVRTSISVNGHTSVTDEAWLARTPANVAKTRLAIPAGFKRIVPQHGSGVSVFETSVPATAGSCAQS
jgi:hypothetical protein